MVKGEGMHGEGGGMCGKGSMHGEGGVRWRGACMAKGWLYDKGEHAWQRGDEHGEGDVHSKEGGDAC